MPTWSDKLLQEVIRALLDANYEPQFSSHSHGFRPGRGCHTAMQEIGRVGKGTKWFIEGDISTCFDRIVHEILVKILAERIHDNRFLRLMQGLLDAGYLEDWRFNATYSGVPQGGVVSPILSNLVLDRLDRFVEKELIAANTRGRRRKTNPPYVALTVAASRARKRGDLDKAWEFTKKAQAIPSREPGDPNFHRLWYVRYADDFLLGFTGPKAEAVEIKQRIAAFLRDELKLDLSDEKTLITHARDEVAKFLGYEVHVLHADDQHDQRGQRCINGGIGFRVPKRVIEAHCAKYIGSRTTLITQKRAFRDTGVFGADFARRGGWSDVSTGEPERRGARAPRHIVCDKGPQFWCPGFKRWGKRHKIKPPRFGAVGQHGSIAVVERFILTLKTLGTRPIVVPLRRQKMREELQHFQAWYNGERPHTTLRGATPDEVYHRRHPTCRYPCFEPRARWPRGSPCARPHVPIRGWPGQRLELQVDYHAGRSHLPVVAIRRAA